MASGIWVQKRNGDRTGLVSIIPTARLPAVLARGIIAIKGGVYSVTWHRNGELLEEQGHVTDLLTHEAVKWIHDRSKTPFFLFVPFTAVHLPLKEPARWVEQVPNSIDGEVARHYAASVMHLDHSVGRILEALDAVGRRNNTLFVFTSDNGGSTAENVDPRYPDDGCPHGRLPANNRPFRGQKGSIYEGGTRVPTIVSWPGRIHPGKNDTPVCIVDWMPTFCALAGYRAETDTKWDGVDLSGMLLRNATLAKRSIYIAGPRWEASSLRYGNWKLIVKGQRPQQTIELFDLAKDPSETQNLANRKQERVETMLTRLVAAARLDRDAVGEATIP